MAFWPRLKFAVQEVGEKPKQCNLPDHSQQATFTGLNDLKPGDQVWSRTEDPGRRFTHIGNPTGPIRPRSKPGRPYLIELSFFMTNTSKEPWRKVGILEVKSFFANAPNPEVPEA